MKKRSRILVVATPLMVILFCLLVYQYGYLKIKEEVALLREMQDMKIRKLEKYINIISEKPDLEKKLTILIDRRKADSSKIIEAQTLSLSAATLQETVKGIITGKGGSIASERVEKPEDFETFKIINVVVDATVPGIRALSDILYGIETRTPYLVVRELDTRIMNIRDPKELMVKIKISALTNRR